MLIQLTDKERSAYARVENDYKIAPKFSMPARVIRVSSNGKTAIIRHFGSGRSQEAHIQQVRFLTLPSCPILRQQWLSFAQRHATRTIDDPAIREQYIKSFWEELQDLQDPILSPMRQKRQRLLQSES